MGEVDKRGKLDEDMFSYHITKDDRILLYWHDKLVKILAAKQSQKFLGQIASANDDKEIQLIMAKVTGNFKRGNEREGKSKR
jgi:hypothetical protein